MVQIDLDREFLDNILDVIDLAVDNDRGLMSSSALFEADDDQLVVKGTDRNTMSRVAISSDRPEVDIDGEGTFSIEMERLDQWVGNVLEETVTLTYEGGDSNSVRMECGSAEGFFRSLDPDTFSSFMDKFYESEEDFTCPVEDLLNAFEFVKPFVNSSSTSNPNDQYNVSEFTGSTLMGTDSKVFSVYESQTINSDLRIGGEELKDVVRFLKKIDKSGDVTVYEGEDVYFLKQEDYIFGYTGPVAKFPDTDGVPIDLMEDEVWNINCDKLNRSIKALTATADYDDRSLNVYARGSGEDAKIELKMKDALEQHDSRVEFDIDRERQGPSEEVDFSINYEYLQDALDLYSQDDVKLAYAGQYLKLHQELDNGDKQVCMCTLQVR